MSDILDHLAERVLLCDGGMGSQVQEIPLSVEGDFHGHENCTDYLSLSRPDLIREIHCRYFAAGADMVETNSFGASPLTLEEFGLGQRAFEINQKAAMLAREAAEEFKDGRKRFVLGSIGPGVKLPTLGHVSYDALEAAFTEQARGLLCGGVDALLVETCQDMLQIKAAVNGVKAARAALKRDAPVFVQVTVETTGTLLAGADIAAVAVVMKALDVPLLGMNCATGPQEMSEHIRYLSRHWPGLISVQPNAGLPELVDGQAVYPLRPEEMALWHERFISEDGVSLVGSCCGSTPLHTAAVDAMLQKREKGRHRPRPVRRSVHVVPSLASLYSQTPLRQENSFLCIGERCNANGSRQFREFQAAEDWDGITGMAREQAREGAHALDVCTAFVGRDEGRDMTEVVSRLRTAVSLPLVLDSTETPVLEAGFKLYGGKAVLNSISFENGEAQAAERLALAKKYGAAVIALTIDEQGMAKDAASKLSIARRLYDFAVNDRGLDPSDLLFDPLTFTICTGNEDDRGLAMETLKAITAISEEMPDCQTVLGLSNVSFGLKAGPRTILNSVFLDNAVKCGMRAAIVHSSKLYPLHKLAPEEVRVAEDLIFDRRKEGYDPLGAFISLFEGRGGAEAREKKAPETIEEALKQRIVDGDRTGLEADLEKALETYAPLEIVNSILLEGMKVVGELFGSGKMQLPFVLQSAETMKTAVALLQPKMSKKDDRPRGSIVLATVKGDVHDIGKNLVDIILSNNGYKVYNLGIKQPAASIIEAVKQYRPDAVGMSGLLVKSTVAMRENLEEMSREGIDIPVILGGAALTRSYVERDCVSAYASGRVAYAKDAFDGLDLMRRISENDFDGYLAEQRAKQLAAQESIRPVPHDQGLAPDLATAKDVRAGYEGPPPVPPFWGPRLLEQVPLPNIGPFLNETMLYRFHWGYKRGGRTPEEWDAFVRQELKPLTAALLKEGREKGLLLPRAVYGYWKCASQGDGIILYEPDGASEAARFAFPRQRGEKGLCLADFIRPLDASSPDTRDVIGLQAVSMGPAASEEEKRLFDQGRYKDYLHLHGFAVEMAEALAEYVHARIRAELGFAGEDSRDMKKLLQQHYRGARFSFGYPACPRLEDQESLLALLGADRIGLSLSEGLQLQPEQSTSALVVLHPAAKYFAVAK